MNQNHQGSLFLLGGDVPANDIMTNNVFNSDSYLSGNVNGSTNVVSNPPLGGLTDSGVLNAPSGERGDLGLSGGISEGNGPSLNINYPMQSSLIFNQSESQVQQPYRSYLSDQDSSNSFGGMNPNPMNLNSQQQGVPGEHLPNGLGSLGGTLRGSSSLPLGNLDLLNNSMLQRTGNMPSYSNNTSIRVPLNISDNGNLGFSNNSNNGNPGNYGNNDNDNVNYGGHRSDAMIDGRSCKLFVGMIARNLTENDLFQLFSPFGSLQEIHLIKRWDGMSKGCAFVKFRNRDSAEAAIQAYNHYILPGTDRQMLVKYADVKPRHGHNDRHNGSVHGDMNGASMGANALLMAMKQKAENFGLVNNNNVPSRSSANVYADSIMSSNGNQMQHGLGVGSAFNSGSLNAPNGSGLLRGNMSNHLQDAYQQQQSNSSKNDTLGHDSNLDNLGGIGGIHGLSLKNGCTDPLSSLDNGSNARSYSVQLANHFNASSRGPSLSGESTPMDDVSVQSSIASNNSRENVGGYGYNGVNNLGNGSYLANSYDGNGFENNDLGGAVYQTKKPPEGPDGANLFIYHLPRNVNNEDLGTLFAPFGDILSVKVFVDKKTNDPKGFGFVSFKDPANADYAMKVMDGFVIANKRLSVQHKRTSSMIRGNAAF